MGWKSFKRHFNISEIVHLDGCHLCIGTPEKTTIVKICIETGLIEQNQEALFFLASNYPRVINSAPKHLLNLINKVDTHWGKFRAYRFNHDTGEVEVHLCLKFGFPNVTNDGLLMLKKQFFSRKSRAAHQGRLELQSRREWLIESINEQELALREAKCRLAQTEAALCAR